MLPRVGFFMTFYLVGVGAHAVHSDRFYYKYKIGRKLGIPVSLDLLGATLVSVTCAMLWPISMPAQVIYVAYRNKEKQDQD